MKTLQRPCINCETLTTNQYYCKMACRSEYMRKIHIASQRDREIIEALDSGEVTLQQVGDRYGITRERVRQIYKRETGASAKDNRLSLLRKKRAEEHVQKLKESEYDCSACGDHVIPTTLKRNQPGDRRLCEKCRHILKVEGRDPFTLVECLWCKVSFHPNRMYGRLAMQDPKYCSREHWVLDKRHGRSKTPPWLDGADKK